MLRSRVVLPGNSVFRPTGDERAPVPIAGLIDTQDLRLMNVVRGVFDPADVGMAEFTNPNYLSGDTIFKNFALPRASQLGTPFFELDNAKFRRYWPKVAGGSAAVEVAHFVAEGALYESLFDLMPDPPGVAWVLDDRVAEDYATDLLPRAVGYSAALIDYFFRGRLDVDVFDNVEAGDPSQLRLEGRNASDEPLVDGGLLLFADRADGTRERLEPVSGSIDDAIVRGVAAGGDVVSTWFQVGNSAERFVAVYQGTLGDERATPSFPGAVIGKVIGGVRVEHVFADGEIWKIRTPAGVFPSPLTTAEFEDVRWGTAADVLVARTWFGEGQPNRFASFAVQRRPDSIDLVTDPDSGMVILRDLAAAEFPFGAPLGTTIVFDQVIHYRQRLARVNPVTVRLRELGPGGPYDSSNQGQAASPVIEEVRARDFSFNDVFDLVLDPSHNIQFNALGAERYLWDVTGFTADADGRILATIQVFLFAPPNQTQSIEFVGLNFTTGELEEHARAYVDPFLPIDASPIWALLDVGAGRVLASTAGSELAITSEARAEAPPFANPSYVRLGPFVPMSTPGVWLKVFEFYEDGRLAGVLAERLWSVLPLVEFTEDRYQGTLTIRAETQSAVGLETLAATGLRRQDIAAALPVSTAVDVRQITRDMHYLELNVHEHEGLTIALSEGVVPTPTQLFDARTWGAGGTPKLALLAQDSDAAGGAAHVVAWDHEAGRATVVADLPSGFHGLKSATSSAALVTSFLNPDFAPNGFVVRLDAARPPVEFPGEDLRSFVLLDPSHLYSAEDTKFYRLSAPLRRTALPATLAGPAELSGDFHAIRLP